MMKSKRLLCACSKPSKTNIRGDGEKKVICDCADVKGGKLGACMCEKDAATATSAPKDIPKDVWNFDPGLLDVIYDFIQRSHEYVQKFKCRTGALNLELTSEQKQAELKRIKQKIEDKEKEISTLKQQASLLEGSPKSGEPCQPDCQSDCNVKKIQSPPKSVESCQPDCLSDCNINKGQNYSADSCVSDCQGKCNDQTSAGKADPCSLDCQGECNESPQPPLIPNQPRPSPKQQRVSPKMSSTHRTGARPVSQAKAQHVPTPRQAPAPPPRVLPQRQLDPYVNYYDENMCLPECYSSCSRHQGDPGQYDYGYGYNQGYTQVKGRPQPQMQQSMYNPLEDVYAECDPNCPKIAMDKWYSGASRF